MDEERDQTGERLGAYQLDKRYEGLDEPGGQLYAAHHTDTGRSALVLVPRPGEAWAPRSDWSARLTSQSSPPLLATELERPPPSRAKALTLVNLASLWMTGGLACVEDREDANADFTRPPRSQTGGQRGAGRPVWHPMRAGVLTGGVLVLVALVLWLRVPASPQQGATPPEDSHTESTIWMSREGSTSAIGYPMPETAFSEQAKPPCQSIEVAIRGGCWTQIKQDAPCPRGYAEYEGKCYVPVHEKKPEPRALKPGDGKAE